MLSPPLPFTSYSGSVRTSSEISPSAHPGSWKGAPHQVLVIDDDETVLSVSAILLGRAGLNVSTAKDGEAGWDATVRQTFDLIVTDNDMPKLRGLDLIRRLRAADYCAPIVLISGGMLPDDRLLIPLLGQGAVLPKPFSGRELVSLVQRLLNAPLANIEAQARAC